MKKVLFFIAVLLTANVCWSQIVTKQDFENYDLSKFDSNGDGKVDYIEAALTIKDLYGLDKNSNITRSTIVDVPGKTKEKLYISVNDWFIHSFNSGKSVIQLNEKEEGVIIGKGFVENIATHTSFATNSNISAWVIIRVDIKDEKIRITTTIQEYDVMTGQGALGAMSSSGNQMQNVKWQPKDCFPFDSKNYKKTTSKAFVNCHIWSLVIADKLAEAVTNGLTGMDDNW